MAADSGLANKTKTKKKKKRRKVMKSEEKKRKEKLKKKKTFEAYSYFRTSAFVFYIRLEIYLKMGVKKKK